MCDRVIYVVRYVYLSQFTEESVMRNSVVDFREI